jgi:hypothetical protein
LSQTDPHGFRHELFHFVIEQTFLVSSTGDGYGTYGAEARPHRQPALLNQVL